MSEHTAIWDALRECPTTALKEFNNGRFSGLSVDPAWRIQRLTELFGPAGTGWGVEILNREWHWFDGYALAVCTACIWYMHDGEKRYANPYTGGTYAKIGPGLDEAMKGAETDAYGKSAMSIGLAADVYMGRHDGDKYQMPTPPVEQPRSREPQQASDNFQQPRRQNSGDQETVPAEWMDGRYPIKVSGPKGDRGSRVVLYEYVKARNIEALLELESFYGWSIERKEKDGDTSSKYYGYDVKGLEAVRKAIAFLRNADTTQSRSTSNEAAASYYDQPDDVLF